jgi:protein transport protein SEC9
MKKFGFGKKGGDDAGNDDDASRSALFGRKKPSASPANDNPYAQAPPANDPYAASSKSAAGPGGAYQQPQRPGFQNAPARGPGSGGLPSGPGPRRGPSNSSTYSQPPPPYGSPTPQDAQPASSGYGADRYGAAGGYGDNRYDSGGGNRYGAAPAAPRGPGGYGGLGRTNSSDTDAQRDQLFAGAQQRSQNRQPEGPPSGGSGGYGAPSGGGSDAYGGYGAERQLTEEEIEQQEVKNIKKQITDTRQESINSLSRSIALANQAADTGINTMNILARDEERLLNTERRLDEAENYNKIGADRAKKLKHLNRSMFAVHVNNPFTSEKKQREREEAIMENHRQEREQRNVTRKNAWDSSSGLDDTFKNMRMGDGPQQQREYRPSAAESNKYVFTDDDDEENAQAMEDETTINRQMGELGNAVSLLNRVAKAQGQTVQRQIVTADRINEKVSPGMPCFCCKVTLLTTCRPTGWTTACVSTAPGWTVSTREKAMDVFLDNDCITGWGIVSLFPILPGLNRRLVFNVEPDF